MIQRIWALGLLFLLGDVCASQSSVFSGGYGGAGLGGVLGQFKTETTTSLLYPSSAFFAGNQNNANNLGTNVIANLFLGYLYPIKRVYIGPEVYVSFGSPSISSSQEAHAQLPTEYLSTHTAAQLRTTEVGIDLRLGTNLASDSLVYGLVGAAFNKLSADSLSTISRPAIPLVTSVDSSLSEAVTGLRLGGGLEQKITGHIHLRASYVYTHYSTHTASNTAPANSSAPFFQLGPIANTTEFRTNTQEILVSILYQFDGNASEK